MGGKGKLINKKRKFQGHKEDDPEFDLAKKHLKTSHVRSMEKRLIIVLEGAQLETVKVGDQYSLISSYNEILISFILRLGGAHVRVAEL